MIDQAELHKLLQVHADEPVVLSLYLPVPMDPTALRGLPARADALVAAAEDHAADLLPTRTADRQAIRTLVEAHGRDWLGHTVAIFACGPLGLLEAHRMTYAAPERAVAATRPHVRPLLTDLQRHPAYHVVVIDRRHAWVFRVSGERIDGVAEQESEDLRSPGFSGWYGLEAHRVNQRLIQLARHHYHATAGLLERQMRAAERDPLVVGGHERSIADFMGVLPAGLRDRIAGSFIADPHTLTPARVRDFAGQAIAQWVDRRERRLVEQIRQTPPDGLATGLKACLNAVNQHAVRLLVVPDDGLVPGFACARCGTLLTSSEDCPDRGAAAYSVPDLIEEMAVRTRGDGGQVESVPGFDEGVAALLRFPPSAG